MELPAAIDFIVKNKMFLTPQDKERLATLVQAQTSNSLPVPQPPQEPTDIFQVDLSSAASAFQDALKRLKTTQAQNADVAEVGKLLTTMSSVFTMLQKAQAEVINIDRLRKVEQATIDCIKKLPEPTQDEFLTALKEKLEI